MRPLTYFIGTTIDGYIAGPSGETDFFPLPADIQGFLCEEYPETIPTAFRADFGLDPAVPARFFDTVVMGRSTYEPALRAGITDPYEHLTSYVVSTTMTETPGAAVALVTDPIALIRRLKAEPGSGIWLAGGGALAGALLPDIDELVVKQYPVVAGRGIPMFAAAQPTPMEFERTDVRSFPSGALVGWYARRGSTRSAGAAGR